MPTREVPDNEKFKGKAITQLLEKAYTKLKKTIGQHAELKHGEETLQATVQNLALFSKRKLGIPTFPFTVFSSEVLPFKCLNFPLQPTNF